jgi:DNA-binding winged helix-turn-helix (wHTH) protein/tetratricopeptide (TPR) repeat protein
MAGTEPQIFAIGELTLDLTQGRLLSASGDVALRPKAFRLLSVLAQNAGRIVPKDELMSEVWPDVIVSEDSLTQCVHEVRDALGPAVSALLRTVSRRGYMLAEAGLSGITVPKQVSPADPGAIAVMPLQMPTGLPDRTRVLVDGLTHDVISRLARLRSYRVTGRGSVFALRNLSEDPFRLRQLLRVSSVVTGRVVSGDGSARDPFRLVFDLVRTMDGSLDWSDEILISTDSLHQGSARIADKLVNVIALAVTGAEIRLALSDRNGVSDAWSEFHLGLNHALRFSSEGMQAGLKHLSRSTALDPGFSRAHAFLSFCHYHLAFTNQLEDRKAGVAMALAAAEQALEADALGPPAHWAYGRALWLNGNPDAARTHMEQAIALSPSFPNAHYMLGFLECHAGDPARALVSLDQSESLSPFDPFLPSIQITRAVCHLRMGDIEQAADWASRAGAHRLAYGHMLAHAALILQLAGRVEEARATVIRLRRRQPDYDPEGLFRTFYTMPAEVEQAFRKALPALGG